MARMAYVDPAGASERVRELLEKNRGMNIFRMLGHSQSHLDNYCRLGNAIRFKGELDPVLRELAITRTGILCGSAYEVVAHKRIGRAAGVTAEQNAALDDWAKAGCFDERQRAVLRFTDEMVGGRKPSDEAFGAVAAFLAPGALVELAVAIGYYIMTSKFLETFGVDMEPTLEGKV